MISATDFKQVYEDLGINTNKMGCIMLDVAPIAISDVIPDEALWLKEDEPESHTQGNVSENEPHVTLLYGLMRSGLELQKHVDVVLLGWTIQNVEIDKVEFFYAKDPGDDYVVIIALVKVTDELKEANGRLRMLPHIDTFMDYKPHITLAYVKQSSDWNSYIGTLNERLAGTTTKPIALNYGD